MPDYKNGKIYKLTTPHNPELVYYGSTVLPLYRRKSQHKEHRNNHKICSKKIFELGVDDVVITLVEACPCDNKEELIKRERFYIENNPCVNKQIPLRTSKEYDEFYKDEIRERKQQYYKDNIDKIKEYYTDNLDKIRERRHKYAKNNKDKINEKCKEYYKQNKDKIKETKKEYYQQNKDKLKEYGEEYYQQNKDKLKEYREAKKKQQL